MYIYIYINFNGQSLKLPDECGPTISDHTKQHCRNKRSMITPEAWTPVIINNQCSSIKWIERSTKYVLPRIQVCLYLCIKEICQLVKNRKWIPVTADESCPWIFSYHNWQGTFFQFYSTKVRREQAIPIFPLPKAPAKQLSSPDLVRELWETMKVQDVSNS